VTLAPEPAMVDADRRGSRRSLNLISNTSNTDAGGKIQ
jgi:hypothetical protein